MDRKNVTLKNKIIEWDRLVFIVLVKGFLDFFNINCISIKEVIANSI